ncbi:rhomboid family intramembrane serine protease [Sulfitobacter aestuarii]|uniref:Rhomboid family intramembrane serine protease n=1 Tax=Sulfitobacter aestuarii TaxID=2161676 RepID=A0ABW5U6B4_9RHOB
MKHASPSERPVAQATQKSGAPGYLWWLVGAMALIELILSLSETGLFGGPDLRWSAIAIGGFWPPLLNGEVAPLYAGQAAVMFLSYAFLHGGLAHLAMNGVVLLSLGKFVSAHVGAARTLLVLFLSALAGAACFALLSSGDAPMIGASGAAFGLIGLWQAIEARARRRAGLSLRPIFMAMLALIVANIALFVLFAGGLAWQAHLGGWIVGWLMGHGFARR